jgi:hypothetical protein
MIRELFQSHRKAVSITVSAFAIVLTGVYVLRPDLAGFVALVGTWAVPAGFYAATHWETVEAWFGRALSLFGFLNASIERVGISAELQGEINGARRLLDSELEGVLPHPVRIKFVRSVQEIPSLREGEIVIALGSHSSRAENRARGTLAYATADLIRPARTYVDPVVMKSIDYSITRRMLYTADQSALDYFLNTMWPEAIQDEPNLRLMGHKVETIGHHGLLTRVLLTEFLELGRRMYPEFPPPEMLEHTAEFVDHLYRVATKRRDEDLGEALVFRKGRLRVGIVLVADRELAERRGANPYVWRCLRDIKVGCNAVYLLARGKNGTLIEEVLTEIDGSGRVLSVDGPRVYDVETSNGTVSVTLARVLCDQSAYRTDRPAAEMAVVS